jgi:hypothetical protein
LSLVRKPSRVVLGSVVFVGIAWVAFIVFDVVGIVDLSSAGERTAPIARHLFNDRPVEWLQWLILGFAILFAGYGAGVAQAPGFRRLRTFLLILGSGLVLMLFEDAGDARHIIGAYVREVFGQGSGPISPGRVVGTIYLLGIVALPIYAFVRFHRDIWQLPTARRFFVPGLVLYAIAGGGHFVQGTYESVGAFLNRVLFGGRFPAYGFDDPAGGNANIFLIDSIIEESIETIAAAFMLAGILALVAVVSADVRDVRSIEQPNDSV